MPSALTVGRVRVHRSGVRRMLGAPFMVDAMDRKIQLVRLYAIVIAPVVTGNYVSRFFREDAVESGVNGRGAAFARLDNDAKNPQEPGGYAYGYALEVGNSRMRAQRILRTALHVALR
jgi:hypothetical protein